MNRTLCHHALDNYSSHLLFHIHAIEVSDRIFPKEIKLNSVVLIIDKF